MFSLTACAGQSPRIAQPALAKEQSKGQTSRGTIKSALKASPRLAIAPDHTRRITGNYANYASLERFVSSMVRKHGFKRDYLISLFSQAKRKTWTLNYLAKSDATRTGKLAVGGWTRYRARFMEKRRINVGLVFAWQYRDALQRATRQYGVPQEYILAILAVETNFGGYVGTHRILDALTTLGFDYARRGAFFRNELEDFLLMARNEGMDPTKPVGSYAGAMGLGQFMPSSFRKWAVDFNGDGRRDLWNAEDAIGSIANYFVQHGWQVGQAVVTPLRHKGTVRLETGIKKQYSLATLQRAGLQAMRPCNEKSPLRLLLLRHATFDQYLIGHPNFYTITRYNQSAYYAMVVHELAQKFKQRLK